MLCLSTCAAPLSVVGTGSFKSRLTEVLKCLVTEGELETLAPAIAKLVSGGLADMAKGVTEHVEKAKDKLGDMAQTATTLLNVDKDKDTDESQDEVDESAGSGGDPLAGALEEKVLKPILKLMKDVGNSEAVKEVVSAVREALTGACQDSEETCDKYEKNKGEIAGTQVKKLLDVMKDELGKAAKAHPALACVVGTEEKGLILPLISNLEEPTIQVPRPNRRCAVCRAVCHTFISRSVCTGGERGSRGGGEDGDVDAAEGARDGAPGNPKGAPLTSDALLEHAGVSACLHVYRRLPAATPRRSKWSRTRSPAR